MIWNRCVVASAVLVAGLGLGCGESSDEPSGSGGGGGAGGPKGGSGGQGGSAGVGKGGSAGSSAGSGGSAAGSGGSGGGGVDPTTSPQCMAFCESLLTECQYECDPEFDCGIDDGECAESTLDYLTCATTEGQLSCFDGGFAVLGCINDETLCN